MKQPTRLFTDEQKQRVNSTVAAAEAKTSAEIVPAVVSASGRYDRAEDLLGLWVALTVLAALFLLVPQGETDVGSWGVWRPWHKLVVLLVGTVLGFVLGAMLGTFLPGVRRLFTPRSQMRDEVAMRARQVFFNRTVHHTTAQTGVLIYLSLYERISVVLADKAALEALGEPALAELRNTLVQGLRSGDITAALCDTIAAAGEKLAPKLPRAHDDVNELPDALVLID